VRGLPTFADPNLIVGADSFSDAGVYRLRDDLYIAQTVDFFPPLVDDPYQFGQIAAANSLSDVYAMGGRPVTALNLVCFPDKDAELSVLHAILAGGAERVLAAGAVVVGGHSLRDAEIKFGLAVTGVVDPSQLITNAAARPGDLLVLTKPLGTGFITTAAKAGGASPESVAAAVTSMIQLNRTASEAARACGVRAATDITGFGLAGHAAELAAASQVSVALYVSALPELPQALDMWRQGFRTRASKSNREFLEPVMQIADGVDREHLELAFDPQTSGGLLLAVAPAQRDALQRHIRQVDGTASWVIGHVQPRQAASLLVLP
jgi:selenide,water dikinase